MEGAERIWDRCDSRCEGKITFIPFRRGNTAEEKL